MTNQHITLSFPNASRMDNYTPEYISTLVNKVYAEAESGMWKDSGSRTNVNDVKNKINEKKLLLAKDGDNVVGTIAVRLMEDNNTGEFGMLVVDPRYRKKRVGSLLVSSAEEWAKERGCMKMRLELWLTYRIYGSAMR